MKISDRETPFFKTIPAFCQTLTFIWKKILTPYPFWGNSKTQTPAKVFVALLANVA